MTRWLIHTFIFGFLIALSVQPLRAQNSGGNGSSQNDNPQQCTGASPWNVINTGGPQYVFGACSCGNGTSSRTLGRCIAGTGSQTCSPQSLPTVNIEQYGCAPLDSLQTAECNIDYFGCYGLIGGIGAGVCATPCASVTPACIACITAIGVGGTLACQCPTWTACCQCNFQVTIATTNLNGCTQ
jgi:hypothetical protein